LQIGNRAAFGKAGAVAPLVSYLMSEDIEVHRTTSVALFQVIFLSKFRNFLTLTLTPIFIYRATKVKGGCLEILYRDRRKIKSHASVATISSYSFEGWNLAWRFILIIRWNWLVKFLNFCLGAVIIDFEGK